MTDEPEQIDVLTSAGDLDPVVVTLRDFVHASGAARAVAVVDTQPAAIVDVGRLAPIEVQSGDYRFHLPHAVTLDAPPLGTVDVKQLPPFDADPETGEIAAPLGGVEHLALAVRALAGLLGGRSVAMAQFDTTTPDLAFSITARGDEPIVLSIGEDEYEMDAGWPPGG